MVSGDGAIIDRRAIEAPLTVFLFQTGAPVYSDMALNSEVVIRLHETDQFKIRAATGDGATAWWAVETPGGKSGFIPSTTKVATREYLVAMRERIASEPKTGVIKIFSGMGLLLCGLLLLGLFVFLVLFTIGRVLVGTLTFSLIGSGGASILWGIENIFSGRHAIRKFDAEWGDALR